MSRISNFNTLPPKKEYIDLILKQLDKGECTITNLIRRTGLTKTQVGCAVDKLVADKKVISCKKSSKIFYMINSDISVD
jgi:hypothetical protein